MKDELKNRTKDMYLPVWLCLLSISWLIFAGIFFSVAKFGNNPGFYILSIISLGIFIAAILCWKNQWVVMLDDDVFIYSTMFGRKKRYYFSEIQDLKQHDDSQTLVLQNGKVHIERCAILSEQFINAINSRLQDISD